MLLAANMYWSVIYGIQQQLHNRKRVSEPFCRMSYLNSAKPINAILAQKYLDVTDNNLVILRFRYICIFYSLSYTLSLLLLHIIVVIKEAHNVWVCIKIIFGTSNTKQIGMSMCPLNIHRFNLKTMGVLSWQN